MKVTWSSSDTSIATVDEYGNVTNVYTGSDAATVTINATAGDKTASCTCLLYTSQDKYFATCHEYLLVYTKSAVPAGWFSVEKDDALSLIHI